MNITARNAVLSVVMAVSFLLSVSASANGATWTVNSINIGGNTCTSTCSFYEALFYSASNDTILFDPVLFSTPQTVTLSGGTFTINKNLTITGPGSDKLIMNGSNTRVFYVLSGTVTISGMTFTGSNTTFLGGGSLLNFANLTMNDVRFTGNNGFGSPGAAVDNQASGVMTISNARFDNNISQFTTGSAMVNNGVVSIDRSSFTSNTGTAIDNRAGMTITNSTFSGNSAPSGSSAGAISSSSSIVVSGCTFNGNVVGNPAPPPNDVPGNAGALRLFGFADISNTTISANVAAGNGSGGGIYFSGGTARLTNVTITGNRGLFGGGIYMESGEMAVRNSIVAGNTTVVGSEVSGTINPGSNNVIGGDALLAPLGFYGGSVNTHALLLGSLAIDTGNSCALVAESCTGGGPTYALTTDARGAARVGSVDIGAFELNGPQNGGTYVATLTSNWAQQVYLTTIIPEAGSTTYCLSTGSLPPGLTGINQCFAARGSEQVAPSAALAIAGTPTTPGTYDFALRGTNGLNSNITNYRLNIFGPSASAVSVAGRVLSSDGRSIRGAIVSMTNTAGTVRTARTNQFGYYRFDDIPAGDTYVVQASSKLFNFTPRVITLGDDLNDLDLIADGNALVLIDRNR